MLRQKGGLRTFTVKQLPLAGIEALKSHPSQRAGPIKWAGYGF